MYIMVYTKFQGYWFIGFGEEFFFSFLPYKDKTAVLVMWPRASEHLFVPKAMEVVYEIWLQLA